ncbi:MAG: prepilin-type N-terminal cleavage/methylation domain-containing protein [Gemmatimonadaceae bacterium]
MPPQLYKVHRSRDPHPPRIASISHRAPRAGVTLMELVVVLVVLGVSAAFVVPSLLSPPREEATVEGVVQAGRARAIARAQQLTLSIDRDGAWTLRSMTPAEIVVSTGQMTAAPGAEIQVQLSPLGACLVSAPPSAEFQDWDVARCARRSSRGSGA